MLYVIHGENNVQSRQKLLEITLQQRLQNKEIVTIDGPKTSLTEVLQATQSASFFGSTRLVVLEDLHKHKSKNMLKQLLTYLSTLTPSESDLILWSSTTLTPTKLKQLNNFTPYLCKTSPVIFIFFDSIKPGNQSQYLKLFQEACRSDPPELIFFLLARHMRYLLLCEEAELTLPPWQRQKLIKQKRFFTQAQLFKLHHQLAELDYRVKSGQTVCTLQNELGYVLAKLS